MLTPEKRSEITLTNIDTSDCGVIALQAVTGWSRRTAEQRAKRDANYSGTSGAGTPRGGLEQALRKAKRVVEDVPFEVGDTVATFALRHEYGMFLIYVDRHVMALVEGNLHNARGHWHAPVEQVVRVHGKP